MISVTYRYAPFNIDAAEGRVFAFARVHMRPISPIRHDRGEEEDDGGGRHIYPRGCENASLIKSILGNRRCMNDGVLVRGCVGSDIRENTSLSEYNGAIRRETSSVFHGDVLVVILSVFAYGASGVSFLSN